MISSSADLGFLLLPEVDGAELLEEPDSSCVLFFGKDANAVVEVLKQ